MMQIIGKAILQFGFAATALAFCIYQIYARVKDGDNWCIAYACVSLFVSVALVFFGLNTVGV